MPTRFLVAAVVAHWLVAGVHGTAHAVIPVPLPLAKDIFIALAVAVLPALGLVFLGSRRRLGAGLILAGLSGALGFGVLHHFVWPGPDHVAAVTGPWAAPFRWSAWLLAVTETVGGMLAIVTLRNATTRRNDATRSYR